MKKIILFYLFILGSIFSCKKSSSTSSTKTNNNQNTSTLKSGYLIGTRSFSISSGTLYLGANTGTAYFLTKPGYLSSMTPVDSVSVSGKRFTFDNASKIYIDQTYMLSLNPSTWEVKGSNSIPSFTYTNNDSLPKCTGFASFADTIYKNQTLNIQVNGISGADLIQVLLIDGSGSGQSATNLLFPVSVNNTISIPSSSLSGFTSSATSPTGSMEINIQKFNDQTFSGLSFRFISQLQLTKNVYIK